MGRRKTFKILPRHTAKGDVVRVFEKLGKRQIDKRKGLIREKAIKKKKSKESVI